MSFLFPAVKPRYPQLSFHSLSVRNGLLFKVQQLEVQSSIDRASSGDHLQVRLQSCLRRHPCNLHSHIFCSACSHNLGLDAAPTAHRTCPACDTSLPNPDDAVSTQLNPTEDYKTSVLSGLSPSTIVECAGRGLAFWSYQSTQEM